MATEWLAIPYLIIGFLLGNHFYLDDFIDGNVSPGNLFNDAVEGYAAWTACWPVLLVIYLFFKPIIWAIDRLEALKIHPGYRLREWLHIRRDKRRKKKAISRVIHPK